MSWQSERDVKRRLKKLEQNQKWPGWIAGGGSQALQPYYTLTYHLDGADAVVDVTSGLQLRKSVTYPIQAAGGIFSSTVPTINAYSIALTAFGADSIGNALSKEIASIDWSELLVKFGAFSRADVVTNPVHNCPTLAAYTGIGCEAFHNRLLLVGYPILEPWKVPYQASTSTWTCTVTTLASLPATTYANNITLGSGNGFCNPLSNLMDNFCAAICPLEHLSALGFNFTSDGDPPRPIAQCTTHTVWAEAVTGDDMSATWSAFTATPSWWATNGKVNDNLKHFHCNFDPNDTAVYGIAWYLFDVYDWWYNITNNGWFVQAALYDPTREFPILLSGNVDGNGLTYTSNIVSATVASQIFDISPYSVLDWPTWMPTPVSSTESGERVFNDISDASDLVPNAINDYSIYPLAVADPPAGEDEGNKYLQRQKE